jgi:hypothetical protein
MNWLKKLCGLFQSKEQKESQKMADRELVERYREVEASDELKEYLALDTLVESDEFVQKKYNWMNKDFKMTPTYATASRYKALLHNEELQSYLEIEDSKRLKDFLKFKASKDYAKLQDKEAVSASPELQRMYDFERSKDYKLYLEYSESELPKEYKALVAQMDTPEFKKEYAFWSNPNRWKTTDEYQQYVRYKQLSKRADIVFYLKQDPKEIARIEKELQK